MSEVSRRAWLLSTAGASAAMALHQSTFAEAAPAEPAFKFCLNTSTVRGQKLNAAEQIDLAAQAGYDAIELWLRDVQAYQESGGSVKDLVKRMSDAGLQAASTMAFPSWIVDDPQERAKGFEQAKRDMELTQQLGCQLIAAPPVGATKEPGLNLFAAAQRYGKLCELGEQFEVIPQVEVWGFSKNLSRLGESVFVAIESGHPNACLLPDVYHIYKGGSDFTGLGMLGPRAIHLFHLNDYPADPPRETINDSYRVYPGDGIAPIAEILRILRTIGASPILSLELFNRDYWKQDALQVAKTGLAKMRAVVEQSK